LTPVDQQQQDLREELNEKIDERTFDLQAVKTSLDMLTKSLLKT
jgi:C4-dicarboxylate-specific signal transduction histidine kinase